MSDQIPSMLLGVVHEISRAEYDALYPERAYARANEALSACIDSHTELETVLYHVHDLLTAGDPAAALAAIDEWRRQP